MTLRGYGPSVGLGITQIIGYGTLMYAYAILLPVMAEDLGLTVSTVFGILSLGLFFGGLLSPLAGGLIDRFGGRWVMTIGSVAAGLALMGFAWVEGRYGLFVMILLAEGAGMFVLYVAAFASVSRLDSTVRPARAISVITLFGGVASTIFWPATLALETRFGWETTWIILGGLVLVVCVPIHFLALSGPTRTAQSTKDSVQVDWPPLEGSARKQGMLWMITSFVFSGYIVGAMMALWVVNVQDLGHSAALAAFAAAVIGPFKTVGRFFEMVVSRNLYPMMTYALSMGLMAAGFAVLLTFGVTVAGVVIAAALYGMGDGIKTIARGTLPLALFGPKGYGARLGWIAFVTMGVNASAPFAFAWISQTYGGWTSFAAMAGILGLAVLTYFLIPDPRKQIHASA